MLNADRLVPALERRRALDFGCGIGRLTCALADHFDEIGQLFGQSPGDGNTWLYIDFYRAVIERLRQEGF